MLFNNAAISAHNAMIEHKKRRCN